ncbi:MAG: CDGSH iron-sulfur domain-containing protein [Anaerolineaceae bacterium]|nr:CDGSH iron-sulfur domain-containing protein [Anaerolineaceae bacterium]
MKRISFPFFIPQGESIFSGCRAGLCRCGASRKKSFCDGMHTEVGFQSE